MLISVCKNSSLSVLTISSFFPEKSCEKQSECTILKDCEPFMNFIKSMEKPLQPTVVHFLRSQECGFDKGYPMVCCFVLPIQVLKKIKSNIRKPSNKLSADSSKMVTPITTKIFENKNFGNPISHVYNKADELNKVFMSDYFDFASSFDLMLRIKRQDDNDFLDIEIK